MEARAGHLEEGEEAEAEFAVAEEAEGTEGAEGAEAARHMLTGAPSSTVHGWNTGELRFFPLRVLDS